MPEMASQPTDALVLRHFATAITTLPGVMAEPLLTREEHLAWAQQRALKHVEIDDLDGALISLHADLSKHPETAAHPDQHIGMVLRLQGRLESHTAMRAHIAGYR